MYLTLEQAEKLEMLVRSIAEHLPEWEFCPPKDDEREDLLRIRHPDGRYFRISALDELRVTISGCWPRGKDGTIVGPWDLHVDFKPLRLAASRGPAVIAREIERRFLPRYTELWGRAKAEVAWQEEYNRQVQEARAKIGNALGAQIPDRHYTFELPSGWVTIEVEGPESITIKVGYVPVETALKVIAVLGRLGETA